ncbi:alpha/beta hydrolase family protein [Pseudovibrio sp. Ad5]|uniref:alpha/beta hydrolase family protein n=1 Tax=Pseudovibrio sp. Ad5 TaxID=989436 RepID=UPI0007AEA83B|nr:alpha/beta fold hydrolase [Pseudovibrio sp. Ad5]
MKQLEEMMAESEQRVETITIPSEGATLIGKAYWPVGDPKSSVIIHGATGVPQLFYAKFARWVAEQGHLCLTYDYRDFGASKQIHPRNSSATMSDWGLYDQQAAFDALLQLADTPSTHVIGHSLGGFMLPFHRNLDMVDKVTTVACGQVYWRDHHMPYFLTVVAFWYLLGPAVTRMKGYLPGKALGIGADIPAGVYWQWRKWCTSPTFFKDDIGSALPSMNPKPFTGPIKIMSFTDDDLAPNASVERLPPLYKDAQVTRQILNPADFELKEVGHLKAFAKQNAVLWPEILDIA